MSRHRVVALGALVLALLASVNARAAIISVSAGSATVGVPPGTNLKNDVTESPLVRAFAEKGKVSVAGLAVNTQVSLLTPGVFTLAANGATGTPGTVTGIVNSYLLHFDAPGDANTPTIDVLTSPGTPAPFNAADGFIRFDEAIVGLLFSTWRLNATDALFGLPGITYPSAPPADPSARGLDTHDSLEDNLWLSADRQTLYYNFRVFGAFDQVRVLTAIPEPTGLALAAVGVMGLFVARRSRRK